MDAKTHRHSGTTYGVAVVSAVATASVSFFVFRWFFNFYLEWKTGHKSVFIIWAEMRAMPLAFLTAAFVFWVVLVSMKRPKQNRS